MTGPSNNVGFLNGTKKIIYNVVEPPIKKYFCQVWIKLLPSFLRKRLKYEKNNRQRQHTQMMAIALHDPLGLVR